MNIETKASNKNAIPSRLVWVDLEMTGLDTSVHRIVEVAAIITDFQFNELASYDAVIYQSDEVLAASNDFCKDLFNRNGLYDQVRASKVTEDEAQTKLRQIIEANVSLDAVFLAGNSIRADWTFLHEQWPKIAEVLHYRMLDVSSFKLWWLGTGHPEYKKAESHRALDDIRESIAELQYYLNSSSP